MRIAIMPDTHVPYHDVKAVRLFYKVLRQCKPDHLVLIGDIADFYSASSFPKDPTRKNDLEWEVACVNYELDKLQRLMGSNVTYMQGNHEHRLERYLSSKAPELFGLVKCSELFRIRQRNWKWVPYHQHFQIGKVLFAHDLGHAGKYAALNTLAAAGKCTVFGHTHRGSVMYGGTVDGEHRFALNVGWLGDPSKVDYLHRAKTRDWQTGFGWIDMDESGRAWAQFVPIVKGRVCVSGRWVK